MLNPLSSIFIEGREWFDRINGNSYHSVSIQVNGHFIAQVGMTYGYGDAYIHTGLDWLIANGYLAPECAGRSASWIAKEFGVVIYASKSSVAKRDLFRDLVKEPAK